MAIRFVSYSPYFVIRNRKVGLQTPDDKLILLTFVAGIKKVK